MFRSFAPQENSSENKIMKNEIVEEVRQHRAAILESFGGDIGKMMRAMIAKQESRGQKVVTLTNREPIFPNAYPLRKVSSPLDQTTSARVTGDKP